MRSLRQIRLFVAAYEEGSFTAAAHRENATQSGVSQHMHKLEARFGVALFSRETGAIHPTPAGDLYYRYCIEILRVHEVSRNEMKKFGCGPERRDHRRLDADDDALRARSGAGVVRG